MSYACLMAHQIHRTGPLENLLSAAASNTCSAYSLEKNLRKIINVNREVTCSIFNVHYNKFLQFSNRESVRNIFLKLF